MSLSRPNFIGVFDRIRDHPQHVCCYDLVLSSTTAGLRSSAGLIILGGCVVGGYFRLGIVV